MAPEIKIAETAIVSSITLFGVSMANINEIAQLLAFVLSSIAAAVGIYYRVKK